MQELAHALFQYIKEVCQLTQKEIFDVDKQPAWVLLSQLNDPACVKLYSRDTVDDETVNNDGKLFPFRKPEFTACPAPDAFSNNILTATVPSFKADLQYTNRKFAMKIYLEMYRSGRNENDSKSNWLFGSGFPILLGFMRVFRLRE